MNVLVSPEPLAINDVVQVARHHATVDVDPRIEEQMAPARRVVEKAIAERQVVYGLTTGFGALANVHIEPSEVRALQYSIVRSHAAGAGDPVAGEIVRAMMVLRARTLAAGHAGARPLLVRTMCDVLNAKITPVVPRFGSVGASGDLAPLAHCALALIGEGNVSVNGVLMSARQALEEANIEPLALEAKEGLALVNGTEGMLGMLCLALHDFQTVLVAADVVAAMTVEALLATDRPFAPAISALRPQPGQAASARNLAKLTAGSDVIASHRTAQHAVQDAYSIRCAPQVHGACRDTYAHALGVARNELASEVDNPIVFFETGTVESAGNFHGEPVAFALDFLAIAACEIASISERRTDRLLDPAHSNGLPAFLAPNAGVNSGFMLAQYTQAAMVAENRRLAHPASVDSIPTSGSTEDHVSMGFHAGLKAIDAVRNARRVLAIEALCAAQALDLRAPLEPSAVASLLVEQIRTEVDAMSVDRALSPQIEAADRMIDELVRIADEGAGGLE